MADQSFSFSLSNLALIPFLITGIWIGICALLARLGGWRRLAETYGMPMTQLQGTLFGFRSAAFGWVSYNNVLKLEAGAQGLSFGVPLPIRVGHPPFNVPWSEITFAKGKRRTVSTVEITFARCPGVVVTVADDLAHELVAAGGVSDRLTAVGSAGRARAKTQGEAL
jgi:hypothetical protein